MKNKKVRRPGVEPGSTAWKAAMLTVIPPTLTLYKYGNTALNHLYLKYNVLNISPFLY